MNSFKLVQHNVKSASFIENNEKEKKKDIEVTVEGGVLIPKDLRKTKYLIVRLKLNLGKVDERLYLTLETIVHQYMPSYHSQASLLQKNFSYASLFPQTKTLKCSI